MNKIQVIMVQKPIVNPVKFIANSTRLTFKTTSNFKDDISYEEASNFDKSIVQNLVKADHSPLEHCSYSFLVLGASRSFLAQVRTHRLVSFTSASQHYSNWENADYEIPIEVFEKCEEINSTEPIRQFLKTYQDAQKAYLDLQKNFGLDHSVTRQVTCQGMRNNLLITANIRQWLTMLGRRECGRNTSEIAYVSWLIRKQLVEDCPDIFAIAGPPCNRYGRCSEGKLCCGHPWKDGINPDEQRWENVIPLGNKWLDRYNAEELINNN